MIQEVLSEKQMEEKIQHVAVQNNANVSLFLKYLSLQTSKINQHNVFFNKFPLHEVKNIFKFCEEQICVKDFENGSRLDLGSSLKESMIKIGRKEQTIHLIKNFDFQKLQESLKTNPIHLLEIDGKYFLDSDGNHRMMALKFLYFLELSKQNANAEEINQKFTFTFPVKHLNHSYELIEIASRIMQKQKMSRFPNEYFVENINELLSFYSILTYNKNTATYNINYQGFSKQNANEKEAILFLSKLEQHEKPYNVYELKDGFALEMGNMLTLRLTKEQLSEKIANLDLSKTTFSSDFFIVQKNNSLFDSILPAKTYYADHETVLKMYSALISSGHEQVTILTKEQVQKNYFKNLDIADIQLNEKDAYVKVFEKQYHNLTKEDLAFALSSLLSQRQFCKSEFFSVANTKQQYNFIKTE